MEWKKNDRIQVTIEDMGDTGEGIGKTDGYTWFVKDAVIGDEVEAKVMKTKKSYGFARLEKIINASPNRVTPRCPVARQCGGGQPPDFGGRIGRDGSTQAGAQAGGGQ